jgi:hypothetical protein
LLTVEVAARRKRRLFDRPRCIAVFSFRYDAQLVPALIENLRPVVDGWISWDDRQAASSFTGDTERRKRLIQAAYDAGAQWVLAMDPDERLERAAAEIVPRLIRAPLTASWSFRLRELYAPDAYRVDGVWGEKRQSRLFRLFHHQFPIADKGSFQTAELHQPWVSGGMGRRHAELNLYHLKMITPERRQARSALYNALDPEARFQRIGYDYLADDSGAVLEKIAAGREYLPAHEDDAGLWMALPDSVAPINRQ